GRERFDVRERRAAVAVVELQLTEAGRVDHERAPGEPDQLPVCRRVSSGAILRDGRRAHDLGAGDPVDERRLADSRRAEYDGRRRGAQMFTNRVETVAGDVAH